MSENQEFHSQIIEVRGKLQSVPSAQALVKANRFLLLAVIVLTVLVAVLGYFVVPPHQSTAYLKKQQSAANAVEGNSVLSTEVNALKGQVIGLVSGSIESKLRMLEDSIRMGAAANSLGTIEDLKNDVKVLRSYSEPSPKVRNAAQAESNQQVLQEMSQLKRLIYVSLASCGLMLAAIASIWFKNLNVLTYKQTIKNYLRKQ
ncbi:hypothetical protein [Methylomicrobium sp. Wu6]|uniref:hypothetical protein n=1 Tax=Methylomicrobium sp. Wu6 TaxID=3107928 RepID=UPI002DD684A5|nr:hypothetical protein [Methylomicrobium sp. Wu6]MEC4750604.1 hypothetical protein [Methylomicrobium sp. Wu6]